MQISDTFATDQRTGGSEQVSNDEAAFVEYMKTLVELENDPTAAKATLVCGPYTAMMLIGALQLTTRHPEMSPSMRSIIRSAVDQLKPLFIGTPGRRSSRGGSIRNGISERPRDPCPYPVPRWP